jgi:hypothetical protein
MARPGVFVEKARRFLQRRGRAGRGASIKRMRLRLLASSWPRAQARIVL